MATRTSILISKTLYQTSIAALIGAIVWVGYSVYQAMTIVPKLEVEPSLLEPLAIELDPELLESISARTPLAIEVDELYESLGQKQGELEIDEL